MNFLPPLPVIIPLLTAAVFMGVGNSLRRPLIDLAAILSSLTVMAICLILFFNSPLAYWFGNHFPVNNTAFGITFVIDKMGTLFASFASLLTALAFIYSWKYFDTVKNLYHSLMLLFLGGMTGFCLTGDLFNLFVFFELMSVAAYSLAGYKNEGPGQLQGALNFAVTNSIGGSLILFGIAFIYSRTGALNLAQAGNTLAGQQMDALIAGSFILITAGFFVKAALVPFHFAGADAHTVGPTPVLILFSGIMSQLAIYGIARIYWTVFSGVASPYIHIFSAVLFTVGSLTIFVGSIMCYAESALKRMLAFSTISNMGIILIGISAFNPDGLKGVVIFILVHGALKSSLFMCTGILLNRFGSTDEIELTGKGKRMPFVGILFTLSALALTGLPIFGALTAKSIIEESVRTAGYGWIIFLFLYESIITGGAMLRASGRIFLGWGSRSVSKSEKSEEEEDEEKETENILAIPAVMTSPIVFLLLFALVTGVYLQFNPQLDISFNEFQSREWYQSLVFNKPLPEITIITHPIKTNFLSGIISVIGIIAVSFFSLFRKYIPIKVLNLSGKLFNPALLKLKSVHSGLVGDYIVWLLLGITLIGIVFAFSLTA